MNQDEQPVLSEQERLALDLLPVSRMEFHVTDLNGVNWVVGKVRAAETELADLYEYFESEKNRLENEIRFFNERFGLEIRDVIASELEKKAHLKTPPRSVKVVNGSPGFRTVDKKIIITDKTAFIDWAVKNLPPAVVFDPRIVTTPIMEYFDGCGDLPPGTDFVPAGDQFHMGVPDIREQRKRQTKKLADLEQANAMLIVDAMG